MEYIGLFIEYYDVLAAYINPFKVVGNALLYGVLVALALLVLLIVFRKKVLIKRQHVVFKIIAWLYFLVVPALGAYFTFQWGIMHGIQTELKANFFTQIEGLVTNTEDGWDTYIVKALTTGLDPEEVPEIAISPDEAVELATEIVYLHYKTEIDSVMSAEGTTGQILTYINNLTDGGVISYGVKKAIHSLLKDGLAIEEEVSAEIMATRIDELMEAGLMRRVFDVQVDRLFDPVKQSILLTFLMILLIPVIEIGIAIYLIKRAEKMVVDEV